MLFTSTVPGGIAFAAPVISASPPRLLSKPISAVERAGAARPMKRSVPLSKAPTDLELMSARIFSEPLVPMHSPPLRGENAALADAIAKFKAGTNSEDLSAFKTFISEFPSSRWRAGLELNLGMRTFELGRLSEALAHFETAWSLSKRETMQLQSGVAERAISEFLVLNGRLGRTDVLKKGLSELGSRTLHGAAAQKLDAAKQGLFVMEHAPGEAFKCGPFAVNTLLYLNNERKGEDPRLKAIQSSTRGTNLAQVKEMSDMVGLEFQMARRSKGAPVIYPSIMHWKVEHFAALTDEHHGRYRVQDPTFDANGSFWITKDVVDSESDGYFLVPAGALPTGWSQVSADEAKNVWGKGDAQNRGEGKSPSSPKTGPCTCNCKGLANPMAWSMQAELNIMDTPLAYSQPIGPYMDFTVNYNQNEELQPTNFTFSNLGAWWTLNWVSWVYIDGSKNARVHVRGGGNEQYNYVLPDNVSNPYKRNLTSQATLTIEEVGVYQRVSPDGTIEVYNLADGSGNYFLTQVIDPQGNAATINWDVVNMRVTSIADANGNLTTVSYVSNTVGNSGYYLISGLTDTFGRSAAFAYESNTYLISITDAVGLVSSFTYQSGASFINSLTTPYGTTLFETYTPVGSPDRPPRGLRFMFPDGTQSVIENWIGHTRETYFWDRHAMSQFPNDPANLVHTHCDISGWQLDTATNNEAPVSHYSKRPLEGMVFFDYPGDNDYVVGTSNLPTKIIRTLHSSPIRNVDLGGTITPGDAVTINITNEGFTPSTTRSVSHTVQSGDTLPKIAAVLAKAINTDSQMRLLGFSATSTGDDVHIQAPCTETVLQQTGSGDISVCEDSSSYSVSRTPSSTATITISTSENTNLPHAFTISGTATTNDVLTATISNIPAGPASPTYTVKSGDSLADIARGLALSIASNTLVQNAGVSATVDGNAVTLFSSSPSTTGYSVAVTSGTGETVTETTLATTAVNSEWHYEYNEAGAVTKSIDPIGRQFEYKYAADLIDLLEVRETRGGDNFLLGKWQYNSQHVPLVALDGSGRKTEITYNALAQPTGITDALSNSTAFSYGNVTSILIGGTASSATSSVVQITVPSLSTSYLVSYTPQVGETAASVATGLQKAINAVSALQGAGIRAASSLSMLSVTSEEAGVTFGVTPTSGMTMSLKSTRSGFLTKIDGPLSGSQDITRFSWHGTGMLGSAIDADGYQTFAHYDNLDRLVKTVFPDNTSEQTTYQNLDPVFFIDRLGRTSQSVYNSMDQLIATIDPLGRKTQYGWCTCGSLATLTDPAAQVTTWHHDLQGRVRQKNYADNTSLDYLYEPETSRLKARIDALGQTTNIVYTLDGRFAEKSYIKAVNETSPVIAAYDLNFSRLTAVSNSWGTLKYSYNNLISDAFGTAITGGGRLASITNSVIPNSTITFLYDALGRTTNRSIDGSNNSVTWVFDAMSRVTSEQNALGTFSYSYVDDQAGSSKGLSRLAQISYPNSQVTTFDWYGSAQDHRLKEIANLKAANGAALSKFNYAHNTAGEIVRWVQQQEGAYQNASLNYDLAGQLLSSQPSGSVAPSPGSSQFHYNYDSAANRTALNQNLIQCAQIGGTAKANDIVNLTVSDRALGSDVTVGYTVQSGDTLSAVATKLAAMVTADANLQAIGVSATANGALVALRSLSTNMTSFAGSVTGSSPTTTITVGMNRSTHNVTVGGTVHVNDVLTVTIRNATLTGGGAISKSHTVASGDTLSSIAATLAGAINGDANLTGKGVTASATNQVIAISSLSGHPTTYAVSVTGTGATTTLSAGISLNDPVNALIGGTKTNGNTFTVTVSDAGLTQVGAQKSFTETVLSGDADLTGIVARLVTAINGDSDMQRIGVSAASSGLQLTLSSNSANITSFVPSKNSGATLTITWSLPPNGTVPVAIGGTPDSGDDIWTITVHDAGFGSGSASATHTFTSGDTLAIIAADLVSQLNGMAGISAAKVDLSGSSVINITSTSTHATTYSKSTGGGATIVLPSTVGAVQFAHNNINQLTSSSAAGPMRFVGGTDRPVQPITINSGAATMLSAQAFRGNPALNSGNNSVSVSATSGGGANTTRSYEINVRGPGSKSLTYDLNGNMTSDGTNSFAWDAENRLVKITYPGTGNETALTYDGLGRCVKIVETGSTPAYNGNATKQFIWCGFKRCEERDNIGALAKQFFDMGQRNDVSGSLTSFYFDRDHLGSIRELTNSSGIVQAQYQFSPFGERTVVSESIPADFAFTGHYLHSRSALNLAIFRAYNPALGRWISRDPLEEQAGSNLYAYVGNEPTVFVDKTGLDKYDEFAACVAILAVRLAACNEHPACMQEAWRWFWGECIPSISKMRDPNVPTPPKPPLPPHPERPNPYPMPGGGGGLEEPNFPTPFPQPNPKPKPKPKPICLPKNRGPNPNAGMA
jgi:RHS repeat-associated protein